MKEVFSLGAFSDMCSRDLNRGLCFLCHLYSVRAWNIYVLKWGTCLSPHICINCLHTSLEQHILLTPCPLMTRSFIPDPWELRLHPALLTSPSGCFWVEGEISTLNFGQEAIYPFLSAACRNHVCSVTHALWFFHWVVLFWVWTWFRFKPEPPPWHGTLAFIHSSALQWVFSSSSLL